MSQSLHRPESDARRRRVLRRRILSRVAMIEEVEARQMLRVPPVATEPVAPGLTQLLRFRVSGVWRYPSFQFDLSNQRLHPDFVPVLAAARAAGWSDYRFLNWMMRPHFDFDELPADALRVRGNDVLMTFLRESETECHG